MKSDRLKTVFVHIPKCGGTSIEELLFPEEERTVENFWMGFGKTDWLSRLTGGRGKPVVAMMNRYQTGGLQHLTALQMRHAMGRALFDSYYRFAVVRHPTRRSQSQYKYIKQRPDLLHWIGMDKSDDFLEYLKKTYRRHHVQWQEQISFLYDFRGNCLVEDIIKLEEIDQGMDVVFEKLGLEKNPVPHTNKSTGGARAPKPLSEDEKDVIWELYKDDFEVLGYDVNQ